MIRYLIAALALLATPAIAQQAELEKARTEVNTVENAADRAVYACSRNQQPKCTDEARTAANAASRALYAIDKAIEAQPGHEHPAPVPDEPRYPKVGDIQPIKSDLDISALLGPKSIPPSGKPDVVGAFRFLCGPGPVGRFDPIVYPGQANTGHLHQFFGNMGVSADSTYESLRTTGESTCQNKLNRSAYWIPAMLDGRGNVVRPDYVSDYYKRRPSTDPYCTISGKDCLDFPTAIRGIFGYDMYRAGEPQPENALKIAFKCIEKGHPVTAAFPDMREVMMICKPGQQLNAAVQSSICWNGKDLDSPNHRDHFADMRRDRTTGYISMCPDSHPYIIPQFTIGVVWSILEGDEPTLWSLSSDAMVPGAAPGSTFHTDLFEAWEPEIRVRWNRGCIDAFRNCSDGDLGDGAIMKRGPHYPSGVAEPRLVSVPERN